MSNMNSELSTFVIAEAGVNHNGCIDTAMKLIDAASEAGADAVKFQSFRSDALLARDAPKAGYQVRNDDKPESQLDMVRKLELTEEQHHRLLAHAGDRDMMFLSTPFDLDSLRLLTQRLGLKTIKVASGEITNAPLLLEIARAADKIILSTGMSNLSEVEAALSVLAFGFTAGQNELPHSADFERAYLSVEGQFELSRRVSLLHCTTEYPAPIDEINLKAIDTLSAAFGLPVGLSDHSEGIYVALAAAARGVRLIEKHFTLDKRMAGPDHKASLEPGELREMISAIRNVERAIGSHLKGPGPAELKNRNIVRKSVVAAKSIREGEMFTEENITCKRPGTGLSPFEFWSLCGKRAVRDYAPDEPV